MDPTNRIARDALRRVQEQEAKVREFEALMDEHGIQDPARFALRQWVEEHLVGPVLDLAERSLRGVQGRN